MKIFQVINVRWFNATAWYALTLSRLLADAGHEVLVLTQADTDTDRKSREMGLNTVARLDPQYHQPRPVPQRHPSYHTTAREAPS